MRAPRSPCGRRRSTRGPARGSMPPAARAARRCSLAARGYPPRVSPVAFVWLFPVAFVLIGGGMVAMAIRGRRARSGGEAAAARAAGEVTDLQWVSSRQVDATSRIAYPVLRFALPDGRTV